ncbi:LemA family protein [Candidatus Micrarchaeota archaeon]|nr:LemA family protein [Candidatus Micrarchaeota archaeon]
MALEWIVIGIVALVAFVLVYYFNALVTLKNRVENAWSQIDVQLKRRFDLIPNLVETVRGYAKHEKGTFEMVAKARSAYMNAGSVKEKGDANNMLTGALKTLFAVAEAYPQLRASENFKELQDELSSTESKIAFSRQFYNDNVMALNTMLETFPSNIVAGMMRLAPKEYYQTDEGERKAMQKAPKVEFG